MKNCVFLDEAGFDVNRRRSRGWTQRGKPAIEETTFARDVSHTVIGCSFSIWCCKCKHERAGQCQEKKSCWC